MGPVASSLRAASLAGLACVKAARITCGSAELGYRRLGSGGGVQALAEVMAEGLVEPVRQFLDDRRGQLRGQLRQVAGDQAGLGHGLPSSRAAVMIAAKSRQSARLPDSARAPASVSR